ncbi:MAG: hypothetical protein ABSF57_07025 [Acidobacteriaceae bacterium]|jgi:hypothetical protein
MPIFLFKGRILPEFADLSIWNVPTVHFSELPHLPDLPDGFTGEFTIAINHSLIDLICVVEQKSVSLSRIHNRAIAYLRAFVDLNCFATGAPLYVILDTAIGPDGVAQSLRAIHPTLGELCTVTSQNPVTSGAIGFDALDTIIREPGMFLALRDLVSALSDAELAAVHCARAVEGLRNLMVPNEPDRGKAWGLFQENLNLDQAYRGYIIGLSVGPRHGDRTRWITGAEVDEILKRSWIIMNRFMVFRKRGSKPLLAPEFDLLTG